MMTPGLVHIRDVLGYALLGLDESNAPGFYPFECIGEPSEDTTTAGRPIVCQRVADRHGRRYLVLVAVDTEGADHG